MDSLLLHENKETHNMIRKDLLRGATATYQHKSRNGSIITEYFTVTNWNLMVSCDFCGQPTAQTINSVHCCNECVPHML